MNAEERLKAEIAQEALTKKAVKPFKQRADAEIKWLALRYPIKFV